MSLIAHGKEPSIKAFDDRLRPSLFLQGRPLFFDNFVLRKAGFFTIEEPKAFFKGLCGDYNVIDRVVIRGKGINAAAE